jgi:multiple sugar transport system permease protein
VAATVLALFSVVLPTAAGLAATAILCFVFSWTDFFFAYPDALQRDDRTGRSRQLHEFEWGRTAAGGTMVMLPVLVFSLLVRRFLISGLTAGAVKG